MSESPIRSRSQARCVGPTTITPQLVTDPTILDSVAGFINEVVPTAHTIPYDTKDQIQWAHFEQLGSEGDASPNYDCEHIIPSAMILVLGYTTGVQVWAIPANGEATEILSWRHGSVRVLRFLPSPYVVGNVNRIDLFKMQRPLVAICDSTSTSPQFSAVNFVSLRSGEQVKVIKFKNPVLNVLANKQSVIVTFQEKIAVFDAFTLEDRLTVTTCYLSPGLQPNPVALGSRWMAYAEKKLNPSKRSSGGNDGEGVQSYTATVLHAAKSLGRGLRELGESVASSLTGNPNYKPGTSPNSPQAGGQSDIPQKGIVTILDIENINAQNPEKSSKPTTVDSVIAHFTAHTEAIVYLKFDPSGMILLTADKRGHDFHLFRIHPHPGGPALAAVHHLYVLHRGDTSAKVQDMCFSPDSRWAVVSTLRGTSHVFPVTPYGGNVGVRTHATPHVVNKMSRFHRSAGLTVDGRSNSPVSMLETPSNSHFPYHNPRFPPYPHPTVVHPLAQIRQPLYVQNQGSAPPRTHTGRQRLSSSSEENISLQVVTCFAPPRAWLDNPPRETPLNKQVKPVESLFIMSCHGMLLQYDLDPHQASSIPKEKVCSETPIELTVSAKAQWLIQRVPSTSDLGPPMAPHYLRYFIKEVVPRRKLKTDSVDDHWLSQVEILTHAGPHRRLWMGPQFTFKTYTTTSGSPLSISEGQPLDLGQTKPVNMPITKANAVLIESSSASSCEKSLLDTYQKTFEETGGAGELQLKEDLADAMLESPGIRETGGRCVIVQMKPAVVAKVVNPLGTVVNVQSDDDSDLEVSEESVIHENCDEALFRPVVTPQPRICHEINKRYVDNIITKSLETTTELAVKILKKNTDRTSHEASPKKSKCSQACNLKQAPTPTSSKIKSKVKVESKPKLNVSLLEMPELTPVSRSLKAMDIPVPESLEKIETNLPSNNKDFNFDFPPLDNDDFFSLENTPKTDKFEDARDSDDTSNKDKKGQNKIANLDESISESVWEEKNISKRNRKPKTKLGVKIANINNENMNTSKRIEDWSSEITFPALPKKTWSSIAATKSVAEKSLIDSVEKEKGISLDLPEIELVQEFTIQLPRKSVSTDLIDIDTPKEEKKIKEEINNDLIDVTEDINLLKIDKSSDDEKGGSSSSPAEATESDDSGKIPEISSVFEDLTSSKTISAPTTKSSRRKKKKK